jgi:hypothetical protein
MRLEEVPRHYGHWTSLIIVGGQYSPITYF